MSGPKLSKQALSREREQLKLYRRLLPSLDLKRRQLSMERDRARQAIQDARDAADAFETRIGHELPMVGDETLDVGVPVTVREVVIGEENVVGVRLPVLERVEYEDHDYALLGRPAWVDVLCERMREAVELSLTVDVARRRTEVLDQAARRITQRVNLFERVLIPRAQANIKRIQIFLGDLERDAVVRSKLAKGKPRHAGAQEPAVE